MRQKIPSFSNSCELYQQILGTSEEAAMYGGQP